MSSIIVREYGAGGNLSYEPWLEFGSREEADDLAGRLATAARATYSLSTLPEDRKASDHDQWLAAAMATLNELDPDARADVRYRVHEVVPFVAPNEKPPESAKEGLYRALRDHK